MSFLQTPPQNLECFSFALLADSHIPESDSQLIAANDGWSDSRLSINPTRNTRATLQAIGANSSTMNVAALVHVGDICDHNGLATSNSYESWNKLVADSCFSGREFFCALGNHDNLDPLKDSLKIGEHSAFSDSRFLAYEFSLGGTPCLMLDARIDQGPIGRIPAEQLEWLVDRLTNVPANDRALLFCHFPLVEEFVPWHKDMMLVENGAEIHALLKQYRDRILGIVSGHTHMSRTIQRDGICYMSVASSSTPFRADPQSRDPDHIVDTRFGNLGYDIMTIVRRGNSSPTLSRQSFEVDFNYERKS